LRNLNNLTLSFAGKIAIVSGYVTGDRFGGQPPWSGATLQECGASFGDKGRAGEEL